MGQGWRLREATLKGFDSIIWSYVFENPVQGSLFFRGNCISLRPPLSPHATHTTHAKATTRPPPCSDFILALSSRRKNPERRIPLNGLPDSQS